MLYNYSVIYPHLKIKYYELHFLSFCVATSELMSLVDVCPKVVLDSVSCPTIVDEMFIIGLIVVKIVVLVDGGSVIRYCYIIQIKHQLLNQ